MGSYLQWLQHVKEIPNSNYRGIAEDVISCSEILTVNKGN